MKIEKKIEEIKQQVTCANQFQCLDNNFEKLPPVEKIGFDNYVIFCRDNKTSKCNYSIPFGRSHFCTCPMRHYLSQGLAMV